MADDDSSVGKWTTEIEERLSREEMFVRNKKVLDQQLKTISGLMRSLNHESQILVSRNVLSPLSTKIFNQTSDPSVRTELVLRLISSCLSETSMFHYETDFTAMSDLKARHKILGGKCKQLNQNSYLSDAPHDSGGGFYTSHFERYTPTETSVNLQGNAPRDLNPPNSKTMVVHYRYSRSDHYYSSATFFCFSESIREKNFSRLVESIADVMTLLHLSIRPTLNMRSYYRHSIAPVTAAVTNGVQKYIGERRASRPEKLSETVENELKRQIKNLTRVSSPLAERPFNERWQLNPKDHFNDERVLAVNTVKNSEESPYLVRDMLYDARRGILLGLKKRDANIRTVIVPNHLIYTTVSRRSMSEIMRELLINSEKYKPPGTSTVIYFDVDSKQRPTIHVGNLCEPIPASEKYRLYEPGVRASNVDDAVDGTGQGLARVKEICDRHLLRFKVEPTLSSKEPMHNEFRRDFVKFPSHHLFAVRIGFKRDQVDLGD